jgi:hypothetical protein
MTFVILEPLEVAEESQEAVRDEKNREEILKEFEKRRGTS